MLIKIERIRKIKYPSGQTQWLSSYLCGCGKVIEKLESSVRLSTDPSCGCLDTKRSDLKYGSLLEARWKGILGRAVNGYPSTSTGVSKCYAEKKIEICKEWKEDFYKFYHWAMNNGFDPKLHIDRIDGNGNYEPSNCRWITQKENNRNGARSKITANEAREILHLHGTYINLDIAAAYDITPSVVCNIAKGRLWTDVHSKYSTEKNMKRANPRFLKPLVNYSKGSIDFGEDF